MENKIIRVAQGKQSTLSQLYINGIFQCYLLEDKIREVKITPLLCNNESLNQAIFIILQDLMGKNILYQKINLIQLANLPDTEEENLIHLYDLQLYIDNYNTKTDNP